MHEIRSFVVYAVVKWKRKGGIGICSLAVPHRTQKQSQVLDSKVTRSLEDL